MSQTPHFIHSHLRHLCPRDYKDRMESDSIFSSAEALFKQGYSPIESWQVAANKLNDIEIGEALFKPKETYTKAVSPEFYSACMARFSKKNWEDLSGAQILRFCKKIGVHPADLEFYNAENGLVENAAPSPPSPRGVVEACIIILSDEEKQFDKIERHLAFEYLLSEITVFKHHLGKSEDLHAAVNRLLWLYDKVQFDAGQKLSSPKSVSEVFWNRAENKFYLKPLTKTQNSLAAHLETRIAEFIDLEEFYLNYMSDIAASLNRINEKIKKLDDEYKLIYRGYSDFMLDIFGPGHAQKVYKYIFQSLKDKKVDLSKSADQDIEETIIKAARNYRALHTAKKNSPINAFISYKGQRYIGENAYKGLAIMYRDYAGNAALKAKYNSEKEKIKSDPIDGFKDVFGTEIDEHKGKASPFWLLLKNYVFIKNTLPPEIYQTLQQRRITYKPSPIASEPKPPEKQ